MARRCGAPCDGCEDFIAESRKIELRTNGAKASQEESEAERRKARLGSTPPDLAEFVTPATQALRVEVSGPPTSPGTGGVN
jgi:hypothetical protein